MKAKKDGKYAHLVIWHRDPVEHGAVCGFKFSKTSKIKSRTEQNQPYPKCPVCMELHKVGKGRPPTINVEQVKKMRDAGLSLRIIAKEVGVTHGAIRAVLARYAK